MADVVVRAPTEVDAEAIAEACNEMSSKLYGVRDTSAEEVRYWLSLPELGTAVAEADGKIWGYADFRRQGGDTLGVDLRVRPSAWGGGAAAALLEEAEALARGATVHCFVSELDEEARGALEQRGYRLIRHSFLMQIDFAEPPEPPVWPRGFTARRYAGEEDLGAVYECHQESFAENWGFRPEPFDVWRRFGVERPDFDPSLWWLAEADGEVAGICLGHWHSSGDPTLGWVGVLAVRKRWRGQGLGLALLRHSFGDFAARGVTKVGLGVDAENATGAVRLYERAGMRPVRRMDVYERAL